MTSGRPEVRELPAGDTALAYEALLVLRPQLGSVEDFTTRIDDLQRGEGYRLVGAFAGGGPALSVGGFRVGHNLAWGRFLYVDDLVTLPSARGAGYGAAVMRWLLEEARRLRCDQLHLDSGTQRHGAHRFYLRAGLDITSFHFATTTA